MKLVCVDSEDSHSIAFTLFSTLIRKMKKFEGSMPSSLFLTMCAKIKKCWKNWIFGDNCTLSYVSVWPSELRNMHYFQSYLRFTLEEKLSRFRDFFYQICKGLFLRNIHILSFVKVYTHEKFQHESFAKAYFSIFAVLLKVSLKYDVGEIKLFKLINKTQMPQNKHCDFTFKLYPLLQVSASSSSVAIVTMAVNYIEKKKWLGKDDLVVWGFD